MEAPNGKITRDKDVCIRGMGMDLCMWEQSVKLFYCLLTKTLLLKCIVTKQ